MPPDNPSSELFTLDTTFHKAGPARGTPASYDLFTGTTLVARFTPPFLTLAQEFHRLCNSLSSHPTPPAPAAPSPPSNPPAPTSASPPDPSPPHPATYDRSFQIALEGLNPPDPY